MQDHRGHQGSRRCGVDHVIDLEICCGVESGPAFVSVGNHGVEACLARLGILDRIQFLAVGELHRTLEPHPAEFPGRPRNRHERGAKASARHRLRTEPISFAQHHGHEGDRERGSGEEQAARVPDQRRALRVGSDHDPRRVAEEQHRQPERLAQLQEARRLVGTVAGDRAGEMHGIVGHDPDGVSLDARKRGDHAAPEAGSQLEHGTCVGDDLGSAVDVVGAPAVLRHDVTQHVLVRGLPVHDGTLKVRERLAGKTHSIGLIGSRDVDDTVLHLHVERTDVVGVDHAESAALDHRRAAHADAGIRRRDDQVGAAEQGRIARKASTRRDPDAGHKARKPSPEREGHHVEPRDHRMIGVARAATTALGKEHNRQAASLDDVEETVLLAVPHDPLSARQHRVVIREHRAVRASLADERSVHPGGPGDEPVSGRAMDEIVDTAPAALRRDRQAAVLDEAPVITEVCDVLARRSAPCPMAGGDDVGTAVVPGQAPPSQRFSEIRARLVLLLLGHPVSLGARVSCRQCRTPTDR